MLSCVDTHVDWYGKPLWFLDKLLGDYLSRTWFDKPPTPPHATNCNDFVCVFLIPLSCPVAGLVGLSLALLGMTIIICALIIFPFCGICILCALPCDDIADFARSIIIFLFGGLAIIVWAVLLLTLWPLLLIVYAGRACCCNNTSDQ